MQTDPPIMRTLIFYLVAWNIGNLASGAFGLFDADTLIASSWFGSIGAITFAVALLIKRGVSND